MSEKLWTDVDGYLNERLVGADPALEAALADSEKAGLPTIAVAPNQGKLLHMLARLVNARRILEMGTLGGYSAIWMARALPADGKLITLEFDPKHADVAAKNLARAGLAERVDIRVGKALDTLAVIDREGVAPFDLVFIDADKANIPAYFDWSVKHARPGALIIVDNVVRDGRVIDAKSDNADVQGVRKFMDTLATDKRVTATALQTVGVKGYDGLAIAMVNG